MEDRFHIIDNEVHGENQYYAFGIYDGHGGSASAVLGQKCFASLIWVSFQFFCDYAEHYLLNAITRRILLSLPGSLNVSQVRCFLYDWRPRLKVGHFRF